MELALQKYLRSGKSPQDLEKEFGIYSYEHPTLSLTGFKYGLIESKKLKFDPVVRECRGIVLDRDNWDIIAYPFNRFYNLGEDLSCEARFDWSNFICQEKVDGSIIIVYYYAGKWRVNTSGSFAQGICNNSGFTWEELFWTTSNINTDKLMKGCVYIFELCTKHNKVVCSYDKPFVSLLGMRENPRRTLSHTYSEFHSDFTQHEANILGVNTPRIYPFTNQQEMFNFLKEQERQGIMVEGFVLCDINFNRIKIKSEDYCREHERMANGNFVYRNIIPELLKGQFKKLSKDHTQWLGELEFCLQEIDRLKNEVDNLWFTYQVIKERKKFAIEITKSKTDFACILFWLFDKHYDNVNEAFIKNPELIVKYFENKHAKPKQSKGNGKTLQSIS